MSEELLSGKQTLDQKESGVGVGRQELALVMPLIQYLNFLF